VLFEFDARIGVSHWYGIVLTPRCLDITRFEFWWFYAIKSCLDSFWFMYVWEYIYIYIHIFYIIYILLLRNQSPQCKEWSWHWSGRPEGLLVNQKVPGHCLAPAVAGSGRPEDPLVDQKVPGTSLAPARRVWSTRSPSGRPEGARMVPGTCRRRFWSTREPSGRPESVLLLFLCFWFVFVVLLDLLDPTVGVASFLSGGLGLDLGG